MEFTYNIPDSTKNVVLERVIKELEIEVYEVCLRIGIAPASVTADYAAPEEGDDGDGNEFIAERRLAAINTRLLALKADKAAL